MHLKKIKTGEFLYSHFNTKDRRKKQHFQNTMLYYFKKDKKNATEMQKKKKAACREGAVTDQMSQKWFVKLRAGDFSQDMLKPSAENHLYQCGMLIILMFGFHIS